MGTVTEISNSKDAERLLREARLAQEPSNAPRPAKTFHDVTLEDIEAHRDEIEETAYNERYIDRSGWGFDDFVTEVEKYSTDDFTPWDLGDNWESPVIKELRKIFRKVCKQMREERL